jgi:acyl dehydratase
LTRALPNVVYVVAWAGCDHVSPVFEEDTLSTTVTVEACDPLPGGGGLVTFDLKVDAHRPDTDTQVLDWRIIALMA